MENETNLYGILAKFDSPEALIAAADRAYRAGYRKMDAYTPYPVEGLDRALRLRASPVPFLVFVGGLSGGLLGFLMQYFATVIDYPQNIGGRPLFSWPAYIPITFETTVLGAALTGLLAMFLFNQFPQPYHPVFRSEDFQSHASQDGFYLGIEASDPQFDRDGTQKWLRELGSTHVEALEA